jgi:hypothetical protein
VAQVLPLQFHPQTAQVPLVKAALMPSANLTVSKFDTSQNLADILTKPLAAAQHQLLAHGLGLRTRSAAAEEE